MLNKCIFKISLLLLYMSSWASYFPDYISTHLGGNFGSFSLHMGYSAQDKIFGELGYGYSPTVFVGRPIHQISSKLSYAPFSGYENELFAIRPILASSINIALGEQYVVFIEDRFRDYYWPSGVQVGFFAGLQSSFFLKKEKRFDVLWEAHTLLVYLLIQEESDYKHLEDIVSQSLSIRFYI